MKKAAQRISSKIEIEFEGKKYSANYYVEKKTLTLSSIWGSKSAIPGPAPESIARMLLRELLSDAKRLGTLD